MRQKRIGILIFTVVILVLAIGASSAAAVDASSQTQTAVTAKVKVPRVVGMRMDRATRLLHSKNLRVNEECTGFFGCIVKRNWWICGQAPRAGRLVPKYSVVTIFGARRGEC